MLSSTVGTVGLARISNDPSKELVLRRMSVCVKINSLLRSWVLNIQMTNDKNKRMSKFDPNEKKKTSNAMALCVILFPRYISLSVNVFCFILVLSVVTSSPCFPPL